MGKDSREEGRQAECHMDFVAPRGSTSRQQDLAGKGMAGKARQTPT